MHRQVLLAALASGLAGLAWSAPAEETTYDYIVIGSGPGGGPLASDLARANYTVLLIEAGSDLGDNDVYTNMANFLTAGNDEHSRWDFWVKHSNNETRERAFGHYVYRVKEGEHGGEEFYVGTDPPPGAKPLGIQYPRAATLGGCAMHNGGVCSLAQDEDWDIIVKMTGDESWKAEKMRKYLIEVEKNEYLAPGTPGHGFNGKRHFRFPADSETRRRREHRGLGRAPFGDTMANVLLADIPLHRLPRHLGHGCILGP